ncbi:hypothetical protein ACQPYK_35045 [Streptosporangium sp. CA-135522]|uniref:hypothetical protein n=1 Tax=Streptosporangium sp. CA-135522 TaxID=3240072 RepID=UPI003D8C2C75
MTEDPADVPPGGGDTAASAAADVPFGERPATFYSPAVSLNRLRPRPDVAVAPADLLLRLLEPPPVKVRHIPLVDVLRKPYRELNGE